MPWRTDPGLPAWLRLALFAPALAIAALALFSRGRAPTADPPRADDAYVLTKPGTVVASWRYSKLRMDSCRWCGRTVNLNRHHIVPQSANPALSDVRENLVVLCRDCHFVLGHRCDWRQYNPDVLYICAAFTSCVRSAGARRRLQGPDTGNPAQREQATRPGRPPAAPEGADVMSDSQKKALERILGCGDVQTEPPPAEADQRPRP